MSLVIGGARWKRDRTLLARAGKRVLVLEKDHFPRFTSANLSCLITGNCLMKGSLAHAGSCRLSRKLGAQFHLGNGSKCLKLVFRQRLFLRVETAAFQVERSTFDHLLLQHTRASGAEVREGWTVTEFSHEHDHVSISGQR